MSDLYTENITLSNGLVLTLSQSNWRISRKKDRLQEQGREAKLEESDDKVFAEELYPVLAAPVISGNCPTLEECLGSILETDLNAWYDLSRKLNPHWFLIFDKIVELASLQEEDADTAIKKDLMESVETMRTTSLTE